MLASSFELRYLLLPSATLVGSARRAVLGICEVRVGEAEGDGNKRRCRSVMRDVLPALLGPRRRKVGVNLDLDEMLKK